jgi:predicted small secreted protein
MHFGIDGRTKDDYMEYVKKTALALAIAVMQLNLSGCNAVDGLGRDFESFGREIGVSAEDSHVEADDYETTPRESKRTYAQTSQRRAVADGKSTAPARKYKASNSETQSLESMYEEQMQQSGR